MEELIRKDVIKREKMIKEFDCSELLFLLGSGDKEEIQTFLEIEIEVKDCDCS